MSFNDFPVQYDSVGGSWNLSFRCRLFWMRCHFPISIFLRFGIVFQKAIIYSFLCCCLCFQGATFFHHTHDWIVCMATSMSWRIEKYPNQRIQEKKETNKHCQRKAGQRKISWPKQHRDNLSHKYNLCDRDCHLHQAALFQQDRQFVLSCFFYFFLTGYLLF